MKRRRRYGRLLLTAAIFAFPHSVAAAQVWSGPLSRLPEADEEIIVTRSRSGHRASLRLKSEGEAAAATLPIGAPLLAAAHVAAFGVEERCAARIEGGRLAIDCAAGRSAAGAVVNFSRRHLPRGAALRLAVRASGDAGFGIAAVPVGEDAAAPETVVPPLSGLAIAPHDNARLIQIVVTAPPGGGRLAIEDLRLEPGVANPSPSAAAWAWEPALWRERPDVLVAGAKRRGIGRLFVSLTIRGGAVIHASALRSFIRLAKRDGVVVEAVEGDPEMVGEGLAAALVRARAIAGFQVESPANARLAGVQYDIEPYIKPGWRDRPESYRAWADGVNELAAAVGEKVDLVVPFWLANSRRGRTMLDRAAPSVRMVTVMAYRTDAAALERIAEPLLAWGARRDRPIRLALEAGPLDDEMETRFIPAPRGTLVLLPDQSLQLHHTAVAVPGARMFAAAGGTRIRAASLSFLGDEARMVEMAERKKVTFGAWTSFVGYAFHGLKWIP